MKYSNYIGIMAAVVLIIACFLPWAYYPDIDRTFTGFFSEHNKYGRPGRLLFIFSIFIIALFVIPKIWAKRLNIIFTALMLAFNVRNYIHFSACYQGFCPEKKIGLYLIVLTSVIMLIASVLPDVKLRHTSDSL